LLWVTVAGADAGAHVTRGLPSGGWLESKLGG
jgi:hypothetical protein